MVAPPRERLAKYSASDRERTPLPYSRFHHDPREARLERSDRRSNRRPRQLRTNSDARSSINRLNERTISEETERERERGGARIFSRKEVRGRDDVLTTRGIAIANLPADPNCNLLRSPTSGNRSHLNLCRYIAQIARAQRDSRETDVGTNRKCYFSLFNSTRVHEMLSKKKTFGYFRVESSRENLHNSTRWEGFVKTAKKSIKMQINEMVFLNELIGFQSIRWVSFVNSYTIL